MSLKELQHSSLDLGQKNIFHDAGLPFVPYARTRKTKILDIISQLDQLHLVKLKIHLRPLITTSCSPCIQQITKEEPFLLQQPSC